MDFKNSYPFHEMWDAKWEPLMNDWYQEGWVQTKRESGASKSHAKDLRKA